MERKHRIRVIHPPRREPTFAERMEARARRILEQRRRYVDTPALSLIERQLALTLDQLDETRRLHATLRNEINRTELYVYNELLGLQPRPFHYADGRGAERERLKDKLTHVVAERRRITINEHDRVHVLQYRLLGLLNRHSLLCL